MNGLLKLRSYSVLIYRLAIPTMLENFLLSIVGVVDSLFVARLGLPQVSAVGVAATIIQIYIAVFLAVGTAGAILVSRATGGSDIERLKSTITHTIYVSIILGVGIGVGSFTFAKPMLLLMGPSSDVLSLSIIYFRVVATTAVVISLYTALGSVVRATGDTKSPLKVGLWMNGIHVVLDYLFIYGIWIIPGMGITGAAMATVISRVIGVAFLARVLYKKKLIFPIHRSDWSWRFPIMRQLIRLGLPTALERLFKRSGQVIYFGMIIRMGTLVFAAHRLAGNFTIFTDVVGVGLSSATATLIGQRLGRKNTVEAKQVALVSSFLTVLSMTMVLLVIFLFIKPSAALFTNNSFVIQQIAWVIGIDVLTQPATASVLILTSVLQAGGETRLPMILTGIGIWIFRTGGVYLFGIRLGWGLPGVWFSILIDNYFRAFILYRKYRSGTWIKEL